MVPPGCGAADAKLLVKRRNLATALRRAPERSMLDPP
jgi:hypothetical protein